MAPFFKLRETIIRVWWYMPVITTPWGEEAGRSKVQDYPQQVWDQGGLNKTLPQEGKRGGGKSLYMRVLTEASAVPPSFAGHTSASFLPHYPLISVECWGADTNCLGFFFSLKVVSLTFWHCDMRLLSTKNYAIKKSLKTTNPVTLSKFAVLHWVAFIAILGVHVACRINFLISITYTTYKWHV